jgi:hypothetical protein
MGRQHQEGLLVVAECKRLENTSKVWGISGGELSKRPGPDVGCCINGEENYQPVFLGPSVRTQSGRDLHSIYGTNYSHGFFNDSGSEHQLNNSFKCRKLSSEIKDLGSPKLDFNARRC